MLSHYPELHEERKYAILQWRAVHNLLHCKEQQLSLYRERVEKLEYKLALFNDNELDSLYAENERLTNYIEELENRK